MASNSKGRRPSKLPAAAKVAKPVKLPPASKTVANAKLARPIDQAIPQPIAVPPLQQSANQPASTESAQGDLIQQKLAEAASGRSYMSPETLARQTVQVPLPDPNSIADKAHEGTIIPAERIRRYKMLRMNPIRQLTGPYLVQQLDNWYLGYLQQTVMMWDAMLRRDDTLSAVVPKRKAAIGRKDWDIIIPEEYQDDPEAEAQKAALKYAYQNLRATHAVDQNQIGGVSLMAKQMVEAVGYWYVPHEILWRQTDQGVTCVLNQVPLWFFENRTGRLRFLPYDTSWDGDPLDEGAWMITVGQGIMEACSLLFFYKHASYQDWANYSETHGSPGQVAITESLPNSENWQKLEETVSQISAGFRGVINAKDKLMKIDWTAEGELPMPVFIEYINRAMTTLWMGGDLSTISGKSGTGDNTGASLQGGEMDKFEADDCQMITETCNMQLDPMILRIVFGEGVQQKAFFSYGGARMKDLKAQSVIDTALYQMQFPLSAKQLSADYERDIGVGDDALVKPQPAHGEPGGGAGGGGSNGPWGNELKPSQKFAMILGNERVDNRKLISNANRLLAQKQAIVLKPLRDRLAAIQEITNEAQFKAAVAKLKSDLPAMLLQINKSPVTAKILEQTMTAAILNGMQAKVPVAKANEGSTEGAVKGWFKRRGGTGPAPTDAQRQQELKAAHEAAAQNPILVSAAASEAGEAADQMTPGDKASGQKAWEAHHDAFQKHQAAATIYTKEGDKLSADYYAGRAKHHLEQMNQLAGKFGAGQQIENAS